MGASAMADAEAGLDETDFVTVGVGPDASAPQDGGATVAVAVTPDAGALATAEHSGGV